MLKRIWRWLFPSPHKWTPWETREVKAVGFLAYMQPTMKVQSRFCQRCGLTQEADVSLYQEVDCEETR